MKRMGTLLMLSVLASGCRSRDNAAGYDQAIEDVRKGVKPSHGPVSEQYRKGYREVIDQVDASTTVQQQHQADRERVRELHNRMPKK